MTLFKNLKKDPAILKLQNKYYNFYLFSFLKLITRPDKIFRYLINKWIFLVNFYLYFKSQKKIKFQKKLDLGENNFLIICLQGLPYQYIQIWNIFRKKIFYDYSFHALSLKKNFMVNFYLKMLKIKIIYIEDIYNNLSTTNEHNLNLELLKTEKDYLEYKYKNLEIGKIALATFFRAECSGEILINSENKKNIDRIIVSLLKTFRNLQIFFNNFNYTTIFITEVFIEEYALIAKIAFELKINLIRFNFTAKDNCMIINKVTESNYRKHHASITKNTFNLISKTNTTVLNNFVFNNFKDRYSDKWFLSNRNQLNKKDYSHSEIFKKLEINSNKKIGIIFSHILYDLIYAYGEDVYNNYFDWLGHTLKIVSKLNNTQWLLKVHPSNLWRNELNGQLFGKYEEERAIEIFLKNKLPKNIKLISHETDISTFELMKISDLGVTVRGTTAVEMATMGKMVITAGSGRFDSFDFVNIASSESEYQKMLNDFDKNNFSKFISKDQVVKNSTKFYYGLFNCKPIRLPFTDPKIQLLKDNAISMDDFNYLYDENIKINSKSLFDYVFDKNINEKELLNDYSI